MNTAHEHWGSRLGFILATAGSAVGLGNIWKFPYITGENGGAAFIIIYLGIVFTIGLSAMLAEITIGRIAQTDAIHAFRKIGKPGWSFVGVMGVITAVIILSFYSVVAGWCIAYVVKSAGGAFSGMDAEAIAGAFGTFVSSPLSPIVYHGIFAALTMAVVVAGVGGGIEKTSKVLMPLLFVMLIALAVRSVTLPGASKGLEFFLAPDFSAISAGTVMAALGQAFFSLSLGSAALLTYGSYVDKKTNLGKSVVQITFLDTLVAILAGLAILPAVFAFGMDPAAGPGLTFVTLPTVFNAMPGGYLFAIVFFVLLTIAALTSSISLLETVVSFFNNIGLSRRNATVGSGLLVFLLGIPSSLSVGIWSDIHFIKGQGFLDSASWMTDKLLLPVGGLLICVFTGWIIAPVAAKEVLGDGEPGILTRAWFIILRFVAPVAILLIILSGLEIIKF
ncbi:sodium-dependent transporter [Aliiruegeria sabulilitoris]|uniref:sodium-dependent transporter n=1 Tax=Aliiruegeria sabulilitoris TaxID=1510458 RepID=UPI000834D578|nr:sodium-dependent transporter [Aliiruegeria sabulilitoris]NDR55875.1 sodium-dependent transporter [Pseudoruegeria sp. M32A2M]